MKDAFRHQTVSRGHHDVIFHSKWRDRNTTFSAVLPFINLRCIVSMLLTVLTSFLAVLLKEIYMEDSGMSELTEQSSCSFGFHYISHLY
jgi:hypothetical protein